MKKFGKFLAVLLVAVSLISMTAFANETCSLADTAEGACEIWWMYNKDQHWRACVEHRDSAGNDTIVSSPVDHEFADGVCTVCGRTESKGFFADKAYWIVFIVVAGIGFIIVSKYKPKKLERDEATTFGLDKFKRFP